MNIFNIFCITIRYIKRYFDWANDFSYLTLNYKISREKFEPEPRLETRTFGFLVRYSTVEHSQVIQALTKQGVEPKYSRILRKLYNETSAKVTTEREGDEFKIERGVRQGDPISPKLFTSLLEDIFQELDWESKYGIKLNGFRLKKLTLCRRCGAIRPKRTRSTNHDSEP